MEKILASTVKIPTGVSVTTEGNKVIIQSGENKLERTVKAKGISINVESDEIKIMAPNDRKKNVATGRTIGKHITNMIFGVTSGYVYKLKVYYKHFPIRVSVAGNVVEIENYIGRKQKLTSKIIPGVNVEVKGQEIIVSGIDKEGVGQTAANMEEVTKARRLCNRKFLDGIYLAERGVKK